MKPGTVLDVGAGEGADSIWLAKLGWTVTGVDISTVAIGRAQQEARDAGVSIDWRVADVRHISGQYDLVSAFYPVVRKDSDLFDHLCGLVAPGGTLLFVHHVPDPDRTQGRGPDFSKVMSAKDALSSIPEGWAIEKHEVIERGSDSKHLCDELVRARKVAFERGW